uniref:Si:dkey-74k8.3 n=1 Tax=Amphilophus citrinellus TaxID=61819 RepID=A0A3Q0SC26_AMPCI
FNLARTLSHFIVALRNNKLKTCLHLPHTLLQFFEMVIRFLAEGAASGLNVIAVYVTEILRVTGFDAALTLPRFTPEGVTAVAQWGLVALIAYWLLSIVLRLLIGVIRQVFWIIKTVLGLWIFGLIVTDKQASADTTAVRLAFLVLVCVLLTVLTSGSDKSFAVEDRLSRLEGRVNAVENKKREQ